MDKITPIEIERYIASLNRAGDPLLAEVEARGHRDAVPIVGPEVGVLLYVLAAATGARRMLEIGSAIGYSGLWLARALPADGHLMTIERDDEVAAIARANLERGGYGDRTSIMVGEAPRLLSKVAGPFDLVFNDADKEQYDSMHDRTVDLLRPGGLLVVDNVLWRGEAAAADASPDGDWSETARAVASYNRRLTSDARLTCSILPVRDGLAVAVKQR